MASAGSTTMALATQKRLFPPPPVSDAFLKPLRMKKLMPLFNHPKACRQLRVEASSKNMAVARMTTAVVAAWMVIPDVAQAADSMTPSLQNFLLSIAAGGVVLVVIAGAVIGVSNFDPVKRS